MTHISFSEDNSLPLGQRMGVHMYVASHTHTWEFIRSLNAMYVCRYLEYVLHARVCVTYGTYVLLGTYIMRSPGLYSLLQ